MQRFGYPAGALRIYLEVGGDVSDNLNDRQLRFAMEYPTDYNATQAAIRAGYSEKTAAAKGYDLLRKVGVREKISERQKELLDATFVTQERIVSELAKTAFYDINDYVYVDEAEFDGVISQQVVIRTDVPAEKRGAIVGIKKTQSGIEVKMGDKLKALEDLAGMLGGAATDNGKLDKLIAGMYANE